MNENFLCLAIAPNMETLKQMTISEFENKLRDKLLLDLSGASSGDTPVIFCNAKQISIYRLFIQLREYEFSGHYLGELEEYPPSYEPVIVSNFMNMTKHLTDAIITIMSHIYTMPLIETQWDIKTLHDDCKSAFPIVYNYLKIDHK